MNLKMEVYSSNLVLQGILEVYTSVLWEEYAFKAGTFSIEALITQDNVRMLKPDNIVWIEGDTAGIIEYIQETAGDDGPKLSVKGRLLSGILDRRILWGQYNLYGKPAAMLTELVDDCAVNPTRGDTDYRIIPGLTLGEVPTGGESIRKQQTGGTLLDALTEIGEANTTAFGVKFDPENLVMQFWTRYSVDRSIHQTANAPVFYSTELDDVLSSEYSYNSEEWRNVALVGGEGEGADRAYVTINGDAGDEPTPGITYFVRLSVNPAGSGSVTGSGVYNEGDTATITARPYTHYDFVGWSVGGSIISTQQVLSFTVDSDRTLEAVMSEYPTYTITASPGIVGGVSVSGAGTYYRGDTVRLVATVAPGYTFTGWQENGVTISTSRTLTFTANQDRTLVAACEGADLADIKFTINAQGELVYSGPYDELPEFRIEDGNLIYVYSGEAPNLYIQDGDLIYEY